MKTTPAIRALLARQSLHRADVLEELVRFADDEGRAWPAPGRLASAITARRIDPFTADDVRVALADLVDAGLLTMRDVRPGDTLPNGERAHKGARVYTLRLVEDLPGGDL